MKRLGCVVLSGFCAMLMVFLVGSPAEAAMDAEPGENLFPYDFEEIDEEGVPAGWVIRKAGENAEAASVTAIRDEEGNTVMKVEMPREASVFIQGERSFEIDPSGDYVVAVRLKVENLKHPGSWYTDQEGVRVWLQGSDAHSWLAVHGEGGTDGWVTGFLPFPTGGEERRERFSRINVFLRCLKMQGTVYFKSPVITRLAEGSEISRSFELGDGTKVEQSWLRLAR